MRNLGYNSLHHDYKPNSDNYLNTSNSTREAFNNWEMIKQVSTYASHLKAKEEEVRWSNRQKETIQQYNEQESTCHFITHHKQGATVIP